MRPSRRLGCGCWGAILGAGGRRVRGRGQASRGARRAGVRLVVAGAGGPGSGRRGWERCEALERDGEVVGPGPVVLEAQRRGAGVEREARGDVQQPVAMPMSAWLP